MLLSLGFAAAIVLIGTSLTYAMSDRLRIEERVAIGIVVGVAAVSAGTFLAFELCGMGWAAIGIGAGGPGLAAAAIARRGVGAIKRDVLKAAFRLRLPSRRHASLRPLLAVSVVCAAVTTRVLALSYQRTDRGISAGSLAVWGDWSAHLAYAGSFAYGDNRNLDLPVASGHPFRYHFLADFFGSIFTVTGVTLPQSLTISAWMLALAVPPLLFCVVVRLVRSRLTAFLALTLFLLSGGIGLWYFAADVENDGWAILGSLPRTYARIPDQHLWVDNTISASLYAQRSTLLGLCLGLAAAILLLASHATQARRGFLAAGLLIGLTGIAHAHMLLTAVVLGAIAFVLDRRRTWLWFLVPAVALGMPLAWSIRPQTNNVRWLLGWMAPDAHEPWPWFWFRNVGLILPLFAGIALFGGVPIRLRRMSAPLWLWFLVPNLVVFHPTEGNNTKYFMFWQLAGCIVIADWLRRAFGRSTLVGRARLGVQTAVVCCVILMISAGSLDTLRSMQRSTAIPWVDHDDVAAAEWLRRNSETDDVVVYGTTNTSAFFSLGGRRAVSAFPGWTYDLGIPDWSQRIDATRSILQGDGHADEAIEHYGVDYIVIGPVERTQYQASDDYWRTHGTVVFDRGDYTVYSTA